jgi:acyl-CoA synthetase (AMP-forming)/AMP-acid ligase II
VRIVDTLPRNPAGKVLKSVLRETIRNEMKANAAAVGKE